MVKFWDNLGKFMQDWCKGTHEIKDIMGEENEDIRKLIEENNCSP